MNILEIPNVLQNLSLPSKSHHTKPISRTLTLRKIARRRRRTRHLFKIHHRIVPKHLAARHNIKMVLISILIRPAHIRTPLRIAIIRTQICDHDDNAVAAVATSAA